MELVASEESPEIGTNRALVRRLRVASLACSYAVPVLGLAALTGWLLDQFVLTSLHSALASMKPNTALGFVLGGASLRLVHVPSRRVARVQRGLAAMITLLAAVTLCEYSFDWDAGIDQLLFADRQSVTAVAPGRMSPITAVMFLLLGAALLADQRAVRSGPPPSQWLALAAAVLAVIALLGYLYGVRSMYAVGPFASVALHTALAAFLLALGLLFAHPELGWVRLVVSDSSGGLLIRRLLPAAVVVPVLFGWLRLMGQNAGWYGTEFGLALFAASNVACFSVLISWTAQALHKSDVVRRLAEARVRASEESLAITLQSIGDAVIATDAQGRVVRMNPVAERLTGYSLSRACGRPLREIFHIVNQDTRAIVESPAVRVLREGVVVGLASHTVLIAADGNERPIADSGAPIRDAQGNVRGVVLVFRDMGEEERRAQERERSDQLLRAAYAAGRMVAWEANLGTGALQVSDNAREVLGPIAGRLDRLEDALAVIHRDDRPAVEAAFRQALRGTAQALRFRALRSDTRETLWLEWRSVTRDQPERGGALRGVVIDVTEAVRAEEALRVSEARYRIQFEAAPEAIVTLDVDRGTFIEVNENAERLFGFTRRELSQRDPVSLSPLLQPDGRPSAEAAPEYIRRALAGERPVFEWMHVNAAGEELACEIRLVRLPGGRNLCRGSILDIGERKRADLARRKLEETLRKTEDQLRQAQKMEAVGRLAGGVAHDFNNLLSVILGYGELSLAALPAKDPLRESVEQMVGAGQRAAKLTAQLLAFSRQQVLSARVIDLNDVIQDIAELLHRLIGEDIEVSLTLRAVSNVCVDPSQIEQVLMNLVVNARDAMPRGGRLSIETADVELDSAYAQTHLDVEAGRYVMLAVSDTGSGMDKATVEHIFEPFFTTKVQGKGTGLGLSTVFGIVKQSGGNIWVYSEPGAGTTFKVYLPRTQRPAQPSTAPGSTVKTLTGSETVLLVEDDEQVRGLARTILSGHGYRVLEAATGSDALLQCEAFEGSIDLLLTDVIMPRMSGRELAQHVTSVRPDVKVVFMSGYTDDAIVHHGVLSSEMAFIQKPLLPERLLAKLRQVLDVPTG